MGMIANSDVRRLLTSQEAVDNLYDTAIVISSDTDLIPAVLYIQYKKKKIEYT